MSGLDILLVTLAMTILHGKNQFSVSILPFCLCCMAQSQMMHWLGAFVLLCSLCFLLLNFSQWLSDKVLLVTLNMSIQLSLSGSNCSQALCHLCEPGVWEWLQLLYILRAKVTKDAGPLFFLKLSNCNFCLVGKSLAATIWFLQGHVTSTLQSSNTCLSYSNLLWTLMTYSTWTYSISVWINRL